MANHHIEQEHPDYSAKARMWRRYRHLYAGGEQFREQRGRSIWCGGRRSLSTFIRSG